MNVVCVDDERQALQEALDLCRASPQITSAEGFPCARDALEWMETHPAELAILDIHMPEMNGLDATRAIRKMENTWAASIPIIAMTADAFSENVSECLAAGMNGHIAKPVDMKLVLKEIRRIKG